MERVHVFVHSHGLRLAVFVHSHGILAVVAAAAGLLVILAAAAADAAVFVHSHGLLADAAVRLLLFPLRLLALHLPLTALTAGKKRRRKRRNRHTHASCRYVAHKICMAACASQAARAGGTLGKEAPELALGGWPRRPARLRGRIAMCISARWSDLQEPQQLWSAAAGPDDGTDGNRP